MRPITTPGLQAYLDEDGSRFSHGTALVNGRLRGYGSHRSQGDQTPSAGGRVMIVDSNLSDRMVQIEIDNLISRIGRYPGVVVQPFDASVAFVSPRVRERFFNSVQGTSEATLAHLDAIEELYRQYGLTPTLEVVPSRLTEHLGRELGRRGYAMLQFHAGLCCEPFVAPEPSGVVVEEVALDEGLAQLYVAAWQEPDPSTVRAGIMQWQENTQWRFFLAHLKGKPAGVAILDVRGNTALLGSAATLPEYRGQGVQAALIARRIREAFRAGCDLLVGGAYFGTSSMRNQQRGGLSIAFTRGIWVKTA